MPRDPLDRGERFGRLVVVLGEAGRADNGRRLVGVRCDCGAEKVVRDNNLRSGITRSCGCLKRDNARQQAAKARATLARRREEARDE